MSTDSPAQLHRAFLEAFNRRDIAGLLALYESEATLLPQPGQVLYGLEAIRQALTQFLSLKGTMTMTTTFSVQSGDIALLRGQWALTGTDADGQPVSMSGNSVEVARRQPDGHWRFVIDHPFGAQ